jgi:hypothetical protein
MRWQLCRFVGPALAVLAAASLAGSGSARTSAGPIYVVPGQRATKECNHLAFCRGIQGLWITVPANGEASFLFGCPVRSKERGDFLLGGTDARTSSKHIRVWFEGKLGQLGLPSGQNGTSSGLLFHAVSDNGKQGSFQPILGCISLRQATKRSTISADPPHGTLAPPAAQLRAQNFLLEPGQDRVTSLSCRKRETLVGSWIAVAYGTEGPPALPPVGAISAKTTDIGRTVHAHVDTAATVQHLIHIQVGELCER